MRCESRICKVVARLQVCAVAVAAAAASADLRVLVTRRRQRMRFTRRKRAQTSKHARGVKVRARWPAYAVPSL